VVLFKLYNVALSYTFFVGVAKGLLEKCDLLDRGEGDSAVNPKAINDRIICFVSKS
jgi:hypothetical protein